MGSKPGWDEVEEERLEDECDDDEDELGGRMMGP